MNINKIVSFLFFIVLVILVTTFINALNFTKYPFAGFFFHPNKYVSFTSRANWAGSKEVKPLYRIEYINGEKITNGKHALDKIQSLKIDDEVSFVFSNNSETKEVNIKLGEFTLEDLAVTFLLPLIIGLFFLTMGFAVFKITLNKLAFVNFLSSVFIALFFSTVLDSNTTYWFFRLFALYPLFGASAIHLIILVTAVNFIKKHPLAQYIPYFLASILVLFQQIFLYSEKSVFFIYLLSPIFLAGCVVFSYVYLTLRYIKSKDTEAKRKIRFYFSGLTFGTIVPFIWSIGFAFSKSTLSLDLGIALSIFYPIFVGYAITRDNIFNIQSFVRKTLEYIIFKGFTYTIHVSIAILIAVYIQRNVFKHLFLNILAGIIIFIFIAPLVKVIQQFIYKIFNPERFNLIPKLNEIMNELSYVRDKKTLGIILNQKIAKVLELSHVGFLYPLKERQCVFIANNTIRIDINKARFEEIFSKKSLEYKSNIFIKLSEFEKNEIIKLNATYFLAIGSEKTKAVLIIGDKKNKFDSLYIEEIEFLRSLLPQLNIAITNAELHEEKANQEKLATIGAFSSVIIHEIKNPLGIIKLSAGALKRTSQDEKTQEVLGFIEEEVDRMNETLTNFLSYSRPKTPRKRAYKIEELRSYLYNIKESIENNQISLNIKISDSLLKSYIFVDPDQMKQILLNLLLNAKEASNGKIEVEIIKEDDIKIFVRDEGQGISQEIFFKIFEPFFTTKASGAGFGLSIVKQLAEANDISINWYNEKGATFVLKIKEVENV